MPTWLVVTRPMFEDEINIPGLKADQILMYAILGDPATRMKIPAGLEASVEVREDGAHWQEVVPEGAEKLCITFRPELQNPERLIGTETREQTIARYAEADKAYAFETLQVLKADQNWEGIINRSGMLRLVALGETQSWVHAVKVKRLEVRGERLDKNQREGEKAD